MVNLSLYNPFLPSISFSILYLMFSFRSLSLPHSYRFTQIAVDAQIKTPGGKTYDVIFVGTGELHTVTVAVNGLMVYLSAYKAHTLWLPRPIATVA